MREGVGLETAFLSGNYRQMTRTSWKISEIFYTKFFCVGELERVFTSTRKIFVNFLKILTTWYTQQVIDLHRCDPSPLFWLESDFKLIQFVGSIELCRMLSGLLRFAWQDLRALPTTLTKTAHWTWFWTWFCCVETLWSSIVTAV